jgi:cobaltochelatase CobN
VAHVDAALLRDMGRQFADAKVADARTLLSARSARSAPSRPSPVTPTHVSRDPAARPAREAPAAPAQAEPIHGIRLEPVTGTTPSLAPASTPWRLGAAAFTLLAFLAGAAAAWRRATHRAPRA